VKCFVHLIRLCVHLSSIESVALKAHEWVIDDHFCTKSQSQRIMEHLNHYLVDILIVIVYFMKG